MKITKRQLKKIIKEEYKRVLSEMGDVHPGDTYTVYQHGVANEEYLCCISEEDALEHFHRVGGRGLDIEVRNDRTGEVIASDNDLESW